MSALSGAHIRDRLGEVLPSPSSSPSGGISFKCQSCQSFIRVSGNNDLPYYSNVCIFPFYVNIKCDVYTDKLEIGVIK